MCARYTLLDEDWFVLMEYFGVETSHYDMPSPRYNIAPTQFVPVILMADGKRTLVKSRWGLIPHWAKDKTAGNKMINARAETLLERPSFRNLVQRKRCLIPASGFFEWKRIGKHKQPMLIHAADRPRFAFAGLYDDWLDPSTSSVLRTCTIITTQVNEIMQDVHDRMPVILQHKDEGIWLQSENRLETMHTLQDNDNDKLTMFAVSSVVNNVRNDVPECVYPVD